MEPGIPPPLISNSNQNESTINGDNGVIVNVNAAWSKIVQQPEPGSKIQRLFALLKPLVSSTRVGSNVPTEGCLIGTRRELLQQICTFASNINPPHVCLILGLAGMGKSAIARSITDIVTESGVSVASYFISRSIPESRKALILIQTLAYQLAQQDAFICEKLLATLTSDPGLLQQSVNRQVKRLLVEPLASVRCAILSPLTIIIDGLDEAGDVPALLSEVIEPVAAALSSIPRPVKVIISSRDFRALHQSRYRGGLEGNVNVHWLHELDEKTVRNDMRRFVADGLSRVRKRAGLSLAWPTDAQVDSLTDRAGSLFIYATTALQFVGDGRYSPETRLKQLLDSDRHLSPTDSSSGPLFSELDALYLEVLLNFVGPTPLSLESDLLQRLRSVLAVIVYAAEPMSTRVLSGIVNIRISDLEPIIHGLAAIWTVPHDNDQQIFLCHLSFSEFISDSTRCTEPGLCVNQVVGHELLATACLRKMNRTLHRDICKLIEPGKPLPCIEAYLPGVIEANVDRALRYACLHGVDTHLRQMGRSEDSAQCLSQILSEDLAEFCSEHLLHWVEVRAVLGEDSLRALIRTLQYWTRSGSNDTSTDSSWTRASQMLAELHDMVHEFQMTILATPIEIFGTCLALAPDGLLVSAYSDHPDAMVRRIGHRPDVWLGAQFLFSQAASTTCIATEGNWTACGLVENHESLHVGQSYVLLWSAMPTVPIRLDMPHADDFTLQSLAFSPSADRLVTLSNQKPCSGRSQKSVSFLTVWDLATLRIVSLRRLTRIQGIAFDASGSHLVCSIYDPRNPVICIPVSLTGPIQGPLDGGEWDHLCFSADRSRVVFGKIGGPLFLAGDSSSWCPVELPESNQLHIFFGEKHPTPRHRAHIIVSSDGSVIIADFSVSGTGKFKLRAWSMAQSESPKTFEVFSVANGHDNIAPPALSRDGRLLAYSGASLPLGRRVFMLGELTWKDRPQFVSLRSWHCEGSMLAQFSHDGRLVAGIDLRRVLRVWDVRTGCEIAQAVDYSWYTPFFKAGNIDASKERHRTPPQQLIFTSKGFVASWNISEQSYAVFLSSHVELYRSSWLSRISQFCYWVAASRASNGTELSAMMTYTPAQAVWELPLEVQQFPTCYRDTLGQTGNFFVFALSDTHLVIGCGNHIIGFSSSAPTRVFELSFPVGTAVLSRNRRVLAVADQSVGCILVITLQPGDVRFRGQHIMPWHTMPHNGTNHMELNPDGCRLLVFHTLSLSTAEGAMPPTRQVKLRLEIAYAYLPDLQMPTPQSGLDGSLLGDWPNHWPNRLFPLGGQWFLATSNYGHYIEKIVGMINQPDSYHRDQLDSYHHDQSIARRLAYHKNRPRKKEDRLWTNEDKRLFPSDLSFVVDEHLYALRRTVSFSTLRRSENLLAPQHVGHHRRIHHYSKQCLAFIKNMPQLGVDLVWQQPMLYLNSPQGGPTVLDFSRHPALQQPAPAEEPPVSDPELNVDDQGEYLPFSDDDDYDEDDLYADSDDE